MVICGLAPAKEEKGTVVGLSGVRDYSVLNTIEQLAAEATVEL